MAAAELVIKVLTDVKDAQKGLDATASKASRMGSGIRKAAAPAALALAGIGAAAISAGQAAAEDAQSQAILENALKNTTGASDSAVASVEAHIAAMASATGVADDQLRPAMGNLVRATGDADKAQQMLASSLDVAAATGTDVETVSKAMAKASQGNTGALKKLVPGLDAATLASGDMDAIMAELAKTTGGAAAAAADTAAGKMAIMQNNMDEAKESIGAALLPVMEKFATVLAKVATWVQQNSKLVGIIIGVIAALAAVILVINAAMSVYAAVTAVAAVAEAALLWPILLVIAAIVALIVVIVLIVKHWDTIKRVALQVWNAIKAATAAVVNWLVAAWNRAFAAVSSALRAMGNWFRSVWASIRAAAAAVVAGVKAVWNSAFSFLRAGIAGVKAVINAVWNAIRATASSVAGAVRRAWEAVFSALKRAVGGVASALSGPFNTVKGVIDNVIGAIQNLISWFGRIKVPKISLPKIPGFNSTTTVNTSPTVANTRAMVAPRAAAPSAGVTINIQGAIDPEATARQVRRILSAHDRRMGGGAGLRVGLV